MLVATLLLTVGVFAQQAKVTGSVVDSQTKETLPGVSVIVQGTKVASITDANGKFSITATPGTTLVFTYVGYTAVQLPAEANMVVSMEATIKELGELVVTALNISRPKKALGYAISEVKGSELAQSSTISPVVALQGKVSGVEVARSDGGSFGAARITIRGNSTLRSNNQPIFVVDGVIIDNELSGGSEWGGVDWGNKLKNLNADDFESVSVLKGAAAAALYGTRGLNGAVVITSKKGRARKGIGVNFSQTMNVKKVYGGPNFQNVYGEGLMAGYDQGNPNKFDNITPFPLNSAKEPQLLGSDVTPISYGHKMDGSRVKDYEGNWITYDPQPNNFVNAFETGMYSNSYVSLDGGNENSTFLLSGTNTYEKGIVPRNDFNKNAVFTKITHKLNKYIHVELGMNYTISDAYNPPSPGFASRFIDNDIPRNYNTNVNKHNYRAANGGLPSRDNGDPGYTRPANDMWFSTWENTAKHTEESMRINGRINTTITDWFNISLEGYVDNYYIKSEEKQLGTGYANTGGLYSLGHSRSNQASGKILLNFAKDLTPDIKSNLSAGGELWKTINSYSSAATKDGLLVPGTYTISNSKNAAVADGGYNSGRQINSAYFFGETSWKDQLYISYTGRNDWASTMTYANGSGNNSYFYPSISGAWLFTETMKGKVPAWFQFGKLRLAYAQTGNDFNPYSINSGFTRGGTLKNAAGDLPFFGYDSNTVPNPNLKPERKKAVEFGLNTTMFNNRISLDVTYYKENTFNQIVSLPVPTETGAYTNTINAGNIQNKGIEVELKTTPIKTSSFKWNLDMMYTRNRGKIIDLAPGQTEYILDGSYNYGNTRVASVAIVGGAYGVLMSDSKPKVYTNATNANDPKNGKTILVYNASQRAAYMPRSYVVEKVGDMNTNFFGSFTNTFTYKNFYLRALIDVKIGGDVSSYSGRYGAAYGLLQSTMYGRDAENGGITWTSTKDGTGATYHDGIIPDGVFAVGVIVDGNAVGGMTYQEAYDKKLVEPEHASTWHFKTNTWGAGVINEHVLMENSYIGIREVVLGFDVPSNICKKIKLANLSIQFVGRDLGFLYNTMTDNINPFSIRSNRAGAASEWGVVPYNRTYGITFKVGL